MVALLFVARLAAADECEDDAQLQLKVDDEVKGLNIWSWSWGSIYAAAAVTQTAVAIGIHDNAARIDLTIGAIAAVVGSASLYLLPLRFTLPLKHHRDCATLQKVAEEETIAKSWIGHVGTVVVNAAILLIEGAGFHHWEAGFIGAGIGLAVGELNLWTQPTHLQNKLSHHIQVVPMIGDVRGAAISVTF